MVEKFYVCLIQGRGNVSWRRVRQKGLEPCGSSTLLNPFPPFPSDTPCTRRKGGKVRTPLRGSVQAGTIPGNAPSHGNVGTPQRGSVQPLSGRKGGKVRTPLRGSVQAGTIPGNAPSHGNVGTPQRGSVQPLSGCAPVARMFHEGSLEGL